MNQEIDNKLLLLVLKKDTKSIKLFIDECMSIIWGCIKKV